MKDFLHSFFAGGQQTWPLVPALATLVLATSCAAPRGIIASGKVTPQGEFRGGYNQGLNLASAPIAKAGSAVRQAATQAANQAESQDKVTYTDAITQLQAAALAYSLDPVQTTADVYVRYGLIPRLDAGFKYAFGSYVVDAQYQFLGPTGSPENPGAGAGTGTTYGSIGLQFASQRAKLPDFTFLSEINSLVNFRANRNDVLIPLIFSNSFGPEEDIGALSYGLVYGHSWVSYGFAPQKLVDDQGIKIPELGTQRRNFSSFGGFANLKLGYRYFYLIPAVSLYYQNYGDYALLNGKSTSLSGITVVPSIGFQLRLPNMR